MGIEKLKGSLLSEASEDARKIVEAAETHVARMVEDERSGMAARKKEADREVEKLLEEQRNERIAWARLESKRILAEAREDAIKGVVEDFFDSLSNVRKTPEYKKFLGKAVAEAAAELGGNVSVHIVKGDKPLLPAIKGAKVSEGLEALGGAIVETTDGKIRIDLTLETLFEARRDETRKRIYDKLFGGK
ncbi:V-type ATP synthase subunit E [Candidatus Micrarchaeota archaeon]|nr:V-type ATP synthase subunit E [Candidatus Micrarchaeota archaeon]